MSRSPVFRGSAAALALRHLCDNGPTPDEDLRTAMTSDSTGKDPRTHAGATLRRLEGLGLVKTKVWLTPAGLQELRRLGIDPERAGVVRETEGAEA